MQCWKRKWLVHNHLMVSGQVGSQSQNSHPILVCVQCSCSEWPARGRQGPLSHRERLLSGTKVSPAWLLTSFPHRPWTAASTSHLHPSPQYETRHDQLLFPPGPEVSSHCSWLQITRPVPLTSWTYPHPLTFADHSDLTLCLSPLSPQDLYHGRWIKKQH